MRQVGYYYWRGRPLTLLVRPDGAYVVMVPAWLSDTWHADLTKGRIKLPN